MNARIATVLSSCLVGCLLVAPAWAAPREKRKADFPVAVINVGEIFNNLPRFKLKKAEMKADVARAEEHVKAQQEDIRKGAAELKNMVIGSPEYLDLENKLKKQVADLKTQVQLQKAQFVQREADDYHAVYEEITKEVADYAAQHHIEIVLRVQGGPTEPKTAPQVLQDINKPVVWFAKSRDITQIILDRLNKKDGTPETSRDAPKTEKGKKDPASKPHKDR